MSIEIHGKFSLGRLLLSYKNHWSYWCRYDFVFMEYTTLRGNLKKNSKVYRGVQKWILQLTPSFCADTRSRSWGKTIPLNSLHWHGHKSFDLLSIGIEHVALRFVSLHYIASLFLFGKLPCISLSEYHIAPPRQPLPNSHLHMNLHALLWTWYLGQPHPFY